VHARILALNVPRLLEEVIGEVVAGYASFELVGRQTQDADAAIDAVQPDVLVVVKDTAQAEQEIARIRARRPALRIVALDAAGSEATAYEPGLPPRRIPELSPMKLLNLLHGGAST
jgi:hypothetical protein